jgi:hypothetical protein
MSDREKEIFIQECWITDDDDEKGNALLVHFGDKRKVLFYADVLWAIADEYGDWASEDWQREEYPGVLFVFYDDVFDDEEDVPPKVIGKQRGRKRKPEENGEV